MVDLSKENVMTKEQFDSVYDACVCSVNYLEERLEYFLSDEAVQKVIEEHGVGNREAVEYCNGKVLEIRTILEQFKVAFYVLEEYIASEYLIDNFGSIEEDMHGRDAEDFSIGDIKMSETSNGVSEKEVSQIIYNGNSFIGYKVGEAILSEEELEKQIESGEKYSNVYNEDGWLQFDASIPFMDINKGLLFSKESR